MRSRGTRAGATPPAPVVAASPATTLSRFTREEDEGVLQVPEDAQMFGNRSNDPAVQPLWRALHRSEEVAGGGSVDRHDEFGLVVAVHRDEHLRVAESSPVEKSTVSAAAVQIVFVPTGVRPLHQPVRDSSRDDRDPADVGVRIPRAEEVFIAPAILDADVDMP